MEIRPIVNNIIDIITQTEGPAEAGFENATTYLRDEMYRLMVTCYQQTGRSWIDIGFLKSRSVLK